jgi:signal peptidase I
VNFVNTRKEAPAPSRESLRLELAAEILREFGEVRFRAYGGSMLPAIFPGDILLIRRDSIGRIRQGHAVLAIRAGLFYAHRVVRIENQGAAVRLITRGDALTMEDPAISEDEYLGRVIGLNRGGTQREIIDSASLESCVFGWMLRRSDFLTNTLIRWHSLCLRLSAKTKFAGSGNPGIATEFPQ